MIIKTKSPVQVHFNSITDEPIVSLVLPAGSLVRVTGGIVKKGENYRRGVASEDLHEVQWAEGRWALVPADAIPKIAYFIESTTDDGQTWRTLEIGFFTELNKAEKHCVTCNSEHANGELTRYRIKPVMEAELSF